MSIAIKIDGGAAGAMATVTAGATVTATIEDTAGFSSFAWEVAALDDTGGTYTLTPSGSKNETVTWTAGAAGTAGKLQATGNAGQSPITGDIDYAATRATCKWSVPAATGFHVLVAGEQSPSELVSDPVYGATKLINKAIRTAASLAGCGTGTANAIPMVNAAGTTLSRTGVTSDGAGSLTLGSPNSADTTPISGALEFPIVGKLDSLPAGMAYRMFAYTDPVLDTVPDPDETHDDYILRFGYNVGLNGAARWQDDVTKHAAGLQIEGDVYVYGGHFAELHFQASSADGSQFCRSWLTAVDLDTYEGSNLFTGTFNVQNSAQTVNAISVNEAGLVTLGHEITSAYKATFGSNVVLDAGHVKAGSFSIQGDLLSTEKGYINGHLIVSSQGGISSKTDALCASTHCFQGVGNFDVTGVGKFKYDEGSGHESNVTISRTAAYGGGGLWTIGLGGDRGYLLRFGIASFAHVDIDGTTGALDLVNSNAAYAVNIKSTTNVRATFGGTGIGVFGHAQAAQSADIGAFPVLTDSPASADALRDDIEAKYAPYFTALRTHLRAHGWMA